MQITDSTELHKRMRFWFVQEIAEEEGLLKFLRDRCDDLRRKNARRRVLIREMKNLGERGVAVDSLESLKQTHAREAAKLAALTDTITESLAAKDDLRKAYEKCNDILQESRALIDTFLKEGSDKDYELNLSMYRKAAKLEKQMDAKLAWLLEKYYYRSQTHIEQQQLALDEEAYREYLEEEAKAEKERARAEKEWEKFMKEEKAQDELFRLECGVKSDSEYETD
ncbi:hypothetical protein Tco_0814380 [Tanacetum coccineum]